MSSFPLGWALPCAICVALVSILSSYIYRQEPQATGGFMSVVSFAPGFVVSALSLVYRTPLFSPYTLGAIFIKNVMYCTGFYFRYESLRKYGPFTGALLVATQPIVIFLLGLALLDERLTVAQIISLVITAAALGLLGADGRRSAKGRTRLSLAKYWILPSGASALAVVWDRYFLRARISSLDFFVFDRLTLLPALALAIFACQPRFNKNQSTGYPAIFYRNWRALALIGLLFNISAYTYNLALATQPAAMVSLVRNSAYPLAALIGAFAFKQTITLTRWLSLTLIASAIYFAAV